MVVVHSTHDADGTEDTGSSRANLLLSDLCRGQMMPNFCSKGTTAGTPPPIPPHPTFLHPGGGGWWGTPQDITAVTTAAKAAAGVGVVVIRGRVRGGGGSYLSRLCSGMEPEPEPSIPFFPLNNFSTRATLPVRAASSSSCSFPIPDTTSLQRRGDGGPADDNPRDVP